MKTMGNRWASLLLVLGALLGTGLCSGGRHAEDHERGDVPGWVMITLMSSVLVAGILAIAKPALEGLFNDAMGRVSQP